MTTPILGVTVEGNAAVPIDLPRLLVSRALIQANSGAGKSWILRRLLEQTHGLVPHVVLDVDEEFHTLREKYPYVLAGIAGADCRADLRTAPVLARRILEHGFSTIIGIHELKAAERHAFVRIFIETLMEAKRALWRPLLVVVDEAHKFCPEKEKSEATAAVIDLMTRGRKRGYCGLLATQRISKLSKDAAAEANNKLIGRASLDLDMNRAADELGLSGREERHSLRKLPPGQFFVFGPALSDDVRQVQVGKVLTTHPEPGDRGTMAPPPPPAKMKAILEKLADLPKDAEQEVDELQRLRQECADLRKKNAYLGKNPAAGVRPEVTARAIGEGVRSGREQTGKMGIDALGNILEVLGKVHDSFVDGMQDLRRTVAGHRVDLTKAIAPGAPIDMPVPVPQKFSQVSIGYTAPPAPAKRLSDAPAEEHSTLRLPMTQQRILDGLAELEVLGVPEPERVQVAFLAGYSNLNSKGFANALGAARSNDLVAYRSQGRLALTDAGRALARMPAKPLTGEELRARILTMLGGVHARVLNPLIEAYPIAMERNDLAAAAGYSNVNSKGFANAIGRLRSLGFINYPSTGRVIALPVLFLEGK